MGPYQVQIGSKYRGQRAVLEEHRHQGRRQSHRLTHLDQIRCLAVCPQLGRRPLVGHLQEQGDLQHQ